jgi:predicted phosphate transport protein (TIGR00153 family)
MRWFRALMPREDRFFDLFSAHAKVLVAGSQALRAMLEGGEAVEPNFQLIMDREHDADAITRDVLLAVRRSFITPFDRSNVKDLITSMDDAIDQMQKTAKGVMIFNIREFSPQMKEMADVIIKCAQLVDEAMPRLRSISAEAASLSRIAEEISHLEGVADDLHDRGLKELYQAHGKSDPMAFITGNEVYDHLEKVVDRFDDVANVIHGTMIEHV